MGNSSKNAEDYDIVRNYRNQEWQLAQTTTTRQLWKNRKTHELAEIYRLYAIPSIEDMNRYEIRSTQQNFVKVYHIALSPNQAMCFNQQYVRVLIEFIPVMFVNVGGLELEEALTVLSAVFKGFNAISNNFGLIEPQQQLIGFNQWGKTKVWLNKQFNNNFPPQHLQSNHLDRSRVQASHVRKLFDLVQRKTESGQLPAFLKEQFRTHNPGYLQAVLIVEQFAYKNLLSLQRFIRTDLYARKSSMHVSSNSNFEQTVRNLRGSSNQKCDTHIISQVSASPKPELKRIQSVDSLHAQRHLNHSQSTVQFNKPFKENIDHISGVNHGHYPVKPSIPKIQFQRSSQPGMFMPFLNQPVFVNNTNPTYVRSQFSKESTQHIKRVSILSAHNETEKIDNIASQPNNPPYLEVSPQTKEIKEDAISKIQDNYQVHQIKRQEQVPSLAVVSQDKIQSNINILSQQLTVQGDDTYRSIIDKVESQMVEEDQDISKGQNIPQQYRYERDEQIQVSGTFNFKALYERDNAENLSQPLQQIGEEDFSKERQDESKIKDPELQSEYQSQNRKQQQVNQDTEIQNIPINFQSFAPAKLFQNPLMSFAPNQISFPTQQSIQTEENVQTSKSFQYEQNDKYKRNASPVSSFQQLQAKNKENYQQIESQQAQNKAQPQNYRDMEQILQEKKRVSINLCYQSGENPFYTQCTPVESKFDVVVRRDSTFSQQSERHERPSAFAHLDTDEQIQNYVRNKYLTGKDNFHHEKVKVGRVESQYEKHYVKEPEVQDLIKKKPTKEAVERQNVMGHLRQPARNKISNILQKPEEDFLDVNYLEKSLDKRYSGNLKDLMKKRQEEDALNIAKLDEGLMKFSTSKASLTQKSSKDEKYFDQVQPKVDYKSEYYKWEISTGFQYHSKSKQSAQIDVKKKKKSVKIDNIPTHQFVYQLSSSDYGNLKQFKKQSLKSPYKQKSSAYQSKESYQQNYKTYNNNKPGKISQYQKQSLDDRYNKYVKNSSKSPKIPKTPSINQIMGGKGDSRLMLSPIPEKRFEDDGRMSYDQLRSFLWG